MDRKFHVPPNETDAAIICTFLSKKPIQPKQSRDGDVAQLAVQLLHTESVEGSNPSIATIFFERRVTHPSLAMM